MHYLSTLREEVRRMNGNKIKGWIIGVVVVLGLLWVGASMGQAEVRNLADSLWGVVEAIGSAIMRALESLTD